MENNKDKGIIQIMDGRILFRNFSGTKTKFNDEGRRNFCVVIDEHLADNLLNDGWNVKFLKPRDEGDVPVPYLQVKVNYNSNRPPKVIMTNDSNKQTIIKEDTIDILDWADIASADMTINPYVYEKRDGSGKGVSAYLKTLVVHIVEDELEAMYSDCGHVCDGDCEHCPEND